MLSEWLALVPSQNLKMRSSLLSSLLSWYVGTSAGTESQGTVFSPVKTSDIIATTNSIWNGPQDAEKGENLSRKSWYLIKIQLWSSLHMNREQKWWTDSYRSPLISPSSKIIRIVRVLRKIFECFGLVLLLYDDVLCVTPRLWERLVQRSQGTLWSSWRAGRRSSQHSWVTQDM